jgi:polysaccharide chain length determinant protein (PEP-CTERM system associated)
MDELRNTLLMLSVYLKGVWIKKRYIIISTWLICPIGLALMATKPDTYQSTAKVYADTKSILTPLLSGLAVQTNPDSEIQLIAKTLLSRPNIEEIARETDMDILVTDARAYENLITGLSKSIRLRGTGRQNIYTISYSNADPQVAKKIVTATLNKFVETTLGQNRDESDTATKFLEEQINDYEKRLEAAEQRLTEFKRNYVGLMPGSGDYYSGVASLTKQVEDIDL